MKPHLSAMLSMLLVPVAGATDLAGQSLEDLLATEVVGASKSRQLIAEAPANVTVITAEEIRRYGYRTIADALVRVPGVFVGHVSSGSTLALRGSSANQRLDWGARILLMVDGHRVNDGMYDQALLGYDSLVDIEAVERIEFIKGPGSTLYGGNALYGVVNVITRRGRATEGGTVWSQATPGAVSLGATLGWSSPGGAEWRLSGARRGNPARDSRIDGQWWDGVGRASNLEDFSEYNEQVSLTMDAGQYRLVALASRRHRDSHGTLLAESDGDSYPYSTTGSSRQYLLGGSGRWALGEQSELAALFSVGEGSRAYVEKSETLPWQPDEGELLPGHQPILMPWRVSSRWSGGELRLTSEAFDRQRLSVGVEWRRDFWRDYSDRYWENGVEFYPRASSSARDSVGVYLQDEVALAESWALTVGGRLDKVTGYARELSPRLALVWAPSASSTVKLIHAEAFRPPNAYEYDSTLSEGGQALPMPKPGLERVKSNELLFEYRQGMFSGSAALFANRNEGMITALDGLSSFNQAPVKTRGIELAASWRSASGVGGYANLARQKSRDAAGSQPSTTPEWVASAGLDAQTEDGRYQGAIEWQAVSARHSVVTVERAGGFGVANMYLTARPWLKGPEFSLQVLNLTGRDYQRLSQDTLEDASGRTVWLGVRYTP
nr:TonB-dependent receptor [Craterilacuibacter sp. RT1T]